MTDGSPPAANAARAAGVGQMKSAIAKQPALTTWSHSQPMRRACSIRSASEKPSSRLILARTSSALKCTALSRGASARARVVLPAVGSPMMRILFTPAPIGRVVGSSTDFGAIQAGWQSTAGCPDASRPPALAHQLDEAAEQIVAVARAGRGLGVVLHREHRTALERDAAIGAVE